MSVWKDNDDTARGRTAAGGTSDPQASSSGRVRSRKISPTDYDKQKVSPDQFGSPEAQAWIRKIQQYNADMDPSEAGRLATWAEGQVRDWERHASMTKGQTTIDLTRWLDLNYAATKAGIGQYGGSADFLANLDAQRADQTKANIKESNERRDSQIIGSGYQEPQIRGRGTEDADVATSGGGSLPPKGPPSVDERLVQSFRSEHQHVQGLEKWARAQLKAYREYLRFYGRTAQGERLTAEQWLKANFRNERGMTR